MKKIVQGWYNGFWCYLGNIDMNATYIDDITIHDVLYDMQALNDTCRKDFLLLNLSKSHLISS